jgi:hypothetical protein
MKHRGILVLVLAALTALFASCGGGGEEAGVLAVAFRLDEGTPVISAYVGDPAKDPFELPPGRYYIEALDQDDVVVSLGAVDIEEGEAVSFPPSFAAAGGAADPEQAEPLKTLASFLVDADLAEYAFLEIVSGGFERPLFDPDVEVTAADVETLFGMYEEILAQKDGVLAAFRQIQGRAEVSGGVPHVSSRWAQDGEDLDRPFGRIRTLFEGLQTAPFGQEPDWKEQMRAEQEAEAALAKETHWVMTWNQDLYTGVLRPGFKLEKTLEWEEKHREWEHYAKRLVEDLPGADDQAALAEAQKELDGAIRSDFEAWLAKSGFTDFPADAVDVFVNYFVAETFAAAGQPVSVPTPPPGFWGASTPASPTPDPSWIEGYVQVAGEQWVDEGYGVEAVVAAENLKECLTEAVQAGASRDEAIAQCPAKAFKPKATPQSTETPAAEETGTPAAEETGTPAAEETETPAPEPTEEPPVEETETPAPEPTATPTPQPTATPTPQPTATPAPQGQEVTATGQLTDLYDPSKITANSITLRFNTQGGSVTGEGQVERTSSGGCMTADEQWIDGTMVWTWDVVFSGSYSKDTGQLDGTVQVTFRNVTCQRGGAWSEPWSATLQGSQVAGRIMEDEDWVMSLNEWLTTSTEILPADEDRFVLTVQ